MVRRGPTLGAVPLALMLGQAALPLAASAQQAPGGGTGASAGAAINYSTARLERRLMAVRAAGPVTLDGLPDEAAWNDAPIASHFLQNDPREGEPATFDTEVRVVYDDDALYFAVFAKDDEPGRLIVNDLKKDFDTDSSDGFRIVLDTFHDARNGYTFATNPAGAKYDAQMANEGRDRNANWDGIWDVATRTTETGWYAEIRVPFRTLKFESRDIQTWGVNFERKVRRLNEDSYWSPLPRIYNLDRVSMAGTVEGLTGLRPGMNLRVKPYAATTSSTLQGSRTTGELDAGLDVKYGVTTGLVWDFTVNTDFSQVEADEQQVNLTRFSLFFPEKRDFFLENSGIFQFGTNSGQFGGGGQGGGGGGGREMQLFFSRRIGLSEDGEPIPILGGTRLTGRQGGYSVGVLNIQQREGQMTAAANFTALRLRRDVLANSDIGAILLNKEDNGPHFNRVAGLDANFRFGDLTANAYVARSFSPDLVSQDLASSQGNAYASRAGFNYQSRTWQAQAGHSGIGERFNGEVGFVPRRGDRQFRWAVRPTDTPPRAIEMAAADATALRARPLPPTSRRHSGNVVSGLPLELQLPGRLKCRVRRQQDDRGCPAGIHDQQLHRNPGEPGPVRVPRVLRLRANERISDDLALHSVRHRTLLRWISAQSQRRAGDTPERKSERVRQLAAQRHRTIHWGVRLEARDDPRELQLQHEDVL
jgi:Domain of unknown function (DUF5916)/Carbohydrate family 9 binding domain-like